MDSRDKELEKLISPLRGAAPTEAQLSKWLEATENAQKSSALLEKDKGRNSNLKMHLYSQSWKLIAAVFIGALLGVGGVWKLAIEKSNQSLNRCEEEALSENLTNNSSNNSSNNATFETTYIKLN